MKTNGLYKRDYNVLTAAEEKAIAKAKNFVRLRNKGQDQGRFIYSGDTIVKYHNMLPSAYYFNNSFFPNNYLDHGELSDKAYLSKILKEYQLLLNVGTSERGILNFINTKQYYCLIGSITHLGYDFGHHDGSYLFKEFELTSTFVADYLLIGKNSGGYNFVFIELENPSGHITIKDGGLGATFRKGISQVMDWDQWIEANFSSLKLILQKYKKANALLPDEFTILDKTRIHYAVIAGRRTDFNEKTYRLKRQYLKTNNITILHYDNLIDSLQWAMKAKNY